MMSAVIYKEPHSNYEFVPGVCEIKPRGRKMGDSVFDFRRGRRWDWLVVNLPYKETGSGEGPDPVSGRAIAQLYRFGAAAKRTGLIDLRWVSEPR